VGGGGGGRVSQTILWEASLTCKSRTLFFAVVGQGGGIERITVVVHHQRRVTDEMGVPELTLNGTIPLVLSFARRTSVLAFRVLLWRHIRRYVIRRDTEDEAELLKALPVRRARRRICCGLRAVVMWLGGEGT
jgi:hypothetical protein